ncbi:hypothetical protein BJV85_000803 [Clostridium acetobutylicum]|uniref:Uncharacterized consrved protein, associated with phosphate permease n=1 Tax=Clostridium acetobutylicum (strain ATCC 824 / DSM 792 / JCM 1419 / IAM 19013 / LMG 5710 / NBRC 13948 / NRRL B-527 / VKM B-1787 / 2291 / W) TaxID=272562 RepID=Q97EL6_CLOAB|nr:MULTISPECIES: DUF47 domain-containing protein [Clostridium]AAK81034.1 Uncharacterized consrved protein, associated with phosphate permease [Clostridium acetobutylicum ATCC 824]ADZ22137.1 Conserved hypothetical protein [Clostridium acetobutylicum EA 2018]AEI32687.1 hypothetical protein SMB_G3130 [Clostridium acetobutylicum DSM 1731]AWV78555.1 DUF47 domain-containing protein [Clostridium acetobutylicum]KHD35713.1 phosphate transport regulator [Clostridium acetobutylicum]
MFSLSPKDDKFFDLFIENSNTIYETSLLFRDYVNNPEDSENKLKVIKDMEHKGDHQQHNIINELNKTFVTPFDREDIYSVATLMDDIIDLMEASSSRFVMFDVHNTTEEAKFLAELVVKAAEEIITLMTEFKNMKKSKKLQECIVNLNKIEEEGDLNFRRAVRILFTEYTDPKDFLHVIKWREIYQYMERTLDACETLANVIEGVAMKNA